MKKPGVEHESSVLVFLLWVKLKTVMLESKLLTEIGNPIHCGFSGGQLYECSCAIAEYLVMICVLSFIGTGSVPNSSSGIIFVKTRADF